MTQAISSNRTHSATSDRRGISRTGERVGGVISLVLALAGFAVSASLLVLPLDDLSLRDPFDMVMASPIGWWGPVPVSAVAASAFGAVFMGVVLISCLARGGSTARVAWSVLLGLAIATSLVAAGYVLHAGLDHHMDLAGPVLVVLALTLFLGQAVIHMLREIRRSDPDRSGSVWIALAVGFGVTVVYVAGLWLIPSSERADIVHLKYMSLTRVDVGSGGRRFVRPHALAPYFVPRESPMIGSPDASHLMIQFFDYTDPESRKQYEDLLVVRDRFTSADVAIMPIVYPIDASCNPNISDAESRNDDACALARLSLNVFHARPEAFQPFHEFLMGIGDAEFVTPAVEQAYEVAKTLVGEDALMEAEMEGWGNRRLHMHVNARPPTPDEIRAEEASHHHNEVGEFNEQGREAGAHPVHVAAKTKNGQAGRKDNMSLAGVLDFGYEWYQEEMIPAECRPLLIFSGRDGEPNYHMAGQPPKLYSVTHNFARIRGLQPAEPPADPTLLELLRSDDERQ